MAIAALTSEVIGGRIGCMTGRAIGGVLVIEHSGLESHIGVAALARQPHLFKLALMLIGMATHTRRR